MKSKEELAEQYAEECNSCYSNDYDGFINGWEAFEEKVNKLIKKYGLEIKRIHSLQETEEYAKTRAVNTLWDKIKVLNLLLNSDKNEQ